MVRWVVLAVVLGGCGFRSSNLAPDAAGGSDGSNEPFGCWPHWLDGTVDIDAASVQPIDELSSTADDRWPWISDNGLRLYFSRSPGPKGQGDIFRAERPTTSDPFGAPAEVVNLNSGGFETRAWLTPDELVLVVSTNKDNAGQYDIHINTRNQGDDFGTPDGTNLGIVNNPGTQHYDPFLTADRLHLYLITDTGPGKKLQIVMTTRSSVTADFPAPSPVAGVNTPDADMIDPTLYQGERVMVFAMVPPRATAHLSYASRNDPAGAFGPTIDIPHIAVANFGDADPALSKAGCELYFASNRSGGRNHLFHANVIR